MRYSSELRHASQPLRTSLGQLRGYKVWTDRCRPIKSIGIDLVNLQTTVIVRDALRAINEPHAFQILSYANRFNLSYYVNYQQIDKCNCKCCRRWTISSWWWRQSLDWRELPYNGISLQSCSTSLRSVLISNLSNSNSVLGPHSTPCFRKKTPTHIIGYKLKNSCLILIIFDTKIPHIIRHRVTA